MSNDKPFLTPTGPGWYYRKTEDVTDQIVCVLSHGGGALVFYLVENEFGRKVENDGLWLGPVPMPGEFVLDILHCEFGTNIIGVHGRFDVSSINEIESQLDQECPFDGHGEYRVEVCRIGSQVGDDGRVQIPSYWDIHILSFTPEATPMTCQHYERTYANILALRESITKTGVTA
jgi:hypothetical protein